VASQARAALLRRASFWLLGAVFILSLFAGAVRELI